ncbi:MAG: 6-phosphogluconolactonase [Candidatus Saccharibacteria bacterium]|nr:6-phosphogluconolactonase [Pseudorhodobacter sp.]
MKLAHYSSRDTLIQSLAEAMAGELRGALRKGPATLSVPGGTTPAPVFDALAGMDLDWDRVAIVLNDERWVGEGSDRSNTRLLKARLLVGPAAAATLVPMYMDLPTPEDGLQALAASITPHLPITVLLLGMGNDGHTASLFPGADLLAQALADDARPLMALRAAAAGEPRITLTARVLKAAKHIHILITGAEKRSSLERALQLPATEAPVQVVLDQATVHWAE